MNSTITPVAVTLPPVHAADVKIGCYLADHDGRRLYSVVDIRTIDHDGRRLRVAMLEDARTEDIEPWSFADLARLQLVKHG